MADMKCCPNCGAEPAGNSPKSLCPRCLMLAADRDETAAPAHDIARTDPAAAGPAGAPQPTEADLEATGARDTGEPVTDANPADATGARAPDDLTRTAGGPGAANDAAPGDLVRYFGDYELQKELGRGGMGVVYKALQVSLNRPVALKMIKAGILAGDAEVQRFQRRALTGKLAHSIEIPANPKRRWRRRVRPARFWIAWRAKIRPLQNSAAASPKILTTWEW
jgi:hypothetical protein